jgi:hypothetical protein
MPGNLVSTVSPSQDETPETVETAETFGHGFLAVGLYSRMSVMTQLAENLISTFDRLPLLEQKEVTRLILKRNIEVEIPPVSDEELVLAAEDIFLELDRRESLDAGT